MAEHTRVLVDTSVWVDHLNKGDKRLVELLEHSCVLMHPFVMGELACGNMQNRRELLRLMGDLPVAVVASNEEVMAFIETNALMGKGIGYIDAHLLAAARLNAEACLWTRDHRLEKQASRLGIAA